jgi:predicted small secreted protein
MTMRSKFAMLFLTMLLITGAVALLSACSTVHGAGDDLERGSDDVRKAL